MARDVLLIEDDHDLRNSLSALLAAHGLNVFNAEEGEKGLELYEKHHPLVVVTDLNMPKVNGIDVLAQLTSQTEDLKIFVISGVNNKEIYFEAADTLGVTKCFKKPMDIRALCDAVIEAVDVMNQ
jgi:DNA-binding NtrC family response regulator